jgi:hypothetical protein
MEGEIAEIEVSTVMIELYSSIGANLMRNKTVVEIQETSPATDLDLETTTDGEAEVHGKTESQIFPTKSSPSHSASSQRRDSRRVEQLHRQ